MINSTRTVLTALATLMLLCGAFSMLLADVPIPCVQFAEDASCKDSAACDLRNFAECPDKQDPECSKNWVTDLRTGKFECVTYEKAKSRCLPAVDKNGNSLLIECMIYTYCVYNSGGGGCQEGLYWESCDAAYKFTWQCPEK